MGLAMIALLLLLPACAMHIGPGEHGWVMWDVCGFEGGAEAELEVMGNALRVGCSDSDKPAAVADEVPRVGCSDKSAAVTDEVPITVRVKVDE